MEAQNGFKGQRGEGCNQILHDGTILIENQWLRVFTATSESTWPSWQYRERGECRINALRIHQSP